MNDVVIYIHGQGGNPDEARHYIPLFKDADVIGLDYCSQTPWEAEEEFVTLFNSICGQYKSVTIIANSIGVYFAMVALQDKKIDKAFFISPIVDMQKLIKDMMQWANVSESELCEKGEIQTSFGQTLSWKYLSYTKSHRFEWNVPTHILYGGKDNMTSLATISSFAERTKATLTVMENGGHWFHTDEEMNFLDQWIESYM